MTVSYSREVATSSKAGCFLRLLLRWKGSIYKLMWKDFAIFAFLYYLLGFIYHFALSGKAKSWFESVAEYCQQFGNLIPVAFVLGFYVSLVVSRFWEQYKSIPWPSRMALFVSALLQGNDQRGRMMRRAIMRYLSLAYVLTMSSISPPVKMRFPSLQHLTDAGFMLPNEQKILEGMKTKFNTYFVPLVWAASLVSRARKEGRVKDDFAVKTLIDEINDYRGKCGSLFSYDSVTVPLVYTQVVTIAVYTFFLSCLMGRQYLETPGNVGDMYFPVFTFLQFLFYMGWLKVAETLLNPFGEDDDDFDINRLIDSNLQSSYLVVDEMHQEHPELIKDQYWDTVAIDLPYTQASQQYQSTEEHFGSAYAMKIPASQSQFVVAGSTTKNSMPRISEVDEDADSKHDGDRLLSVTSDQKMQMPERKTTSRTDLSRSSSRMGSFLNLLARSVSRVSRRGQRSDAEDVESGAAVPHESSKDIEMKSKSHGNQSKAKYHQDTIPEDDLMFEMSDDESISSKHSMAAIVSEETKAKGLSSGALSEHSTGKGKNEHPIGQSYRSNNLPSISSGTSKVEENYGTMVSHAAFVEDLRDQLRELRETKETPKDTSTVKD